MNATDSDGKTIRGHSILAATALALLLASTPAHAFPHLVKPGETLAQIAEHVYGRVEMEKLLVTANALDTGAGIPIVPGMRLEVPAVSHHRIRAGETWASLAEALLGDPERSDVLAVTNGTVPWLPPSDGLEIIVPYNLRYVAEAGDTTLSVAYRFIGERDKAWMLDRYNHLRGKALRRGTVMLIPLSDLPLTPEGKLEAENAGVLIRSQGQGAAREAQRKAEAELPLIAADLHNGRWLDVIARANRALGYGELSQPQKAVLNKSLMESYVALDAPLLAEAACAAWRQADPNVVLDPVELSPKVMRVCTAAAISPSSLPSSRPQDTPGAAASSGAAPKAGPSAAGQPPGDPYRIK